MVLARLSHVIVEHMKSSDSGKVHCWKCYEIVNKIIAVNKLYLFVLTHHEWLNVVLYGFAIFHNRPNIFLKQN